MTKENMYGLLDCIAVMYEETGDSNLVNKLFQIYGIELEDLEQFKEEYCYQTLWDLLVDYTNATSDEKQQENDYHDLLTRNTTRLDTNYPEYIDCMFDACKIVGLTDVVIYSNGREDYQGEMDIHVEANLNGVAFYYYLRQDYGSCSYCDWLEGSGSHEVVEKYVDDLKEAIGSLKGE